MIVTNAPLRFSFLGGGTDFPSYYNFHGGAVLGTAVSEGILTVIQANELQRVKNKYILRYSQNEICNSVDEIRHPVFREAIGQYLRDQAVEITCCSSLPSSSGLGSSSSFTVSLLSGIHQFLGNPKTRAELAEEAINLERHILGEKGGQDQLFAAHGGFNLIEFEKHKPPKVNPLQLNAAYLEDLQQSCVLISTGIKRNASEIERAKDDTKITEQLDALKGLAYEGAEILQNEKPIERFGKLLKKAWELKVSLSDKVTTPEIDNIVSFCAENGAWGYKILGAGGGGILLAIGPEKFRNKVAKNEKYFGVINKFQFAYPGVKTLVFN